MSYRLTRTGSLGSAAVRTPPELHPPRLVLVRPPVPQTQHHWLGALGHTLLEMPWLAWSLLDVVIVGLGVHLGYAHFVWTPNGEWVQFGWLHTCLIQCPALVVAGLIFGLYEQRTLLSGSRIISRSFLSTGAAAAGTYLVIYVFMYSSVSRGVLLLASGFYLSAAPTLRLLVGMSVQSYSRRFVIIGTDRKSWTESGEPGEGQSARYRLLGYITLEPMEVGREIGGRPVLGTIDEIEKICVEQQIHEVVVGAGAAKNPRVLDKALGCLKLGCRVTNLSTFYEQVMSEVPLAHLDPAWFLFADLKHYREAQLMVKRICDVAGALAGLVLTLPLWPLIALLIKIDSPGPVFYSQKRVGLNGRIFRLYKFRTMHVEAERDGLAWAAQHDPRVTNVGWYLRRMRLDELPQLWNILCGQMSIVGPRPERPEFVQELSERIRFYNERHLVKPGLSGWAQINYRYGASVEDVRRKLQLDLWYIKHMSLELDLVIILRTLGTMFLGSR